MKKFSKKIKWNIQDDTIFLFWNDKGKLRAKGIRLRQQEKDITYAISALTMSCLRTLIKHKRLEVGKLTLPKVHITYHEPISREMAKVLTNQYFLSKGIKFDDKIVKKEA